MVRTLQRLTIAFIGASFLSGLGLRLKGANEDGTIAIVCAIGLAVIWVPAVICEVVLRLRRRFGFFHEQ